MKFEEIFNNDGDYVADGFAPGVCFRISSGMLYLVEYRSKGDINPVISTGICYTELFKKNYRIVYTRQSLFGYENR